MREFLAIVFNFLASVPHISKKTHYFVPFAKVAFRHYLKNSALAIAGA
jgi:hypothetical protein